MRKEHTSGCAVLFVIVVIVLPFLLMLKSSKRYYILSGNEQGHVVTQTFFYEISISKSEIQFFHSRAFSNVHSLI
jgi:hypothetical protein